MNQSKGEGSLRAFKLCKLLLRLLQVDPTSTVIDRWFHPITCQVIFGKYLALSKLVLQTTSQILHCNKLGNNVPKPSSKMPVPLNTRRDPLNPANPEMRGASPPPSPCLLLISPVTHTVTNPGLGVGRRQTGGASLSH